MRKMLWVFVCIVCCSVASQAEMVSKITSLGEMTRNPAPIDIELVTPEIASATQASATYGVFVRSVSGAQRGFWQVIPDATEITQLPARFTGEHLQTYQFRSAAMIDAQREYLPLLTFEYQHDMRRFAFIRQAGEVGLKQTFLGEEAPEGELYISYTFDKIYDSTQEYSTDFHERPYMGFRLIGGIPTVDWSPYRYVEFYYREQLPDSYPERLWLLIRTAETEAIVPVTDHTMPGHNPHGWQWITLDLNELIGPPAQRERLEQFAFLLPADVMTTGESYTIEFDHFALWSSQHWQQTTLDATRPTQPADPQYEVEGDEMVWRWQPSEDPESGIEGYAVYWGNSGNDEPERKVVVTEPEWRFRFKGPNYARPFYFRVMAKNGAGAWSPSVGARYMHKPRQ